MTDFCCTMGKGYNNYMCKKFFHPTNFENIKRKWMAEQKEEFDSKREQERLTQYRREQEILENRVLLGDEKARLGLAWMYDQPAVMEPEKETDRNEAKFEWQRKYNAPRESYCKNSSDVTDQPFGIEVRNVRCMRCKQWGHLNTDRTCPLYGQSFTQEPTAGTLRSLDRAKSNLRKEGLAFKKSAESTGLNAIVYKAKRAVSSSHGLDPEAVEHELTVEFLRSLSEKQREKLLKKLSKLSREDKGLSSKKHKKKKHSHH
uniref:Corepressor interacting with RBPJ 1 n=1 Tax=Echinococcus granulosus TaxID=6210 RepID=A0A068WRV0_ECHGR|nr:Corepressor interacting with RBPJ 1 [Echinococcus granulosus]